MLRFARRLLRRLLPRSRHPLLDSDSPPAPDDAAFERAYLALTDPSDSFVAARYLEGRRWRNVLAAFAPPPVRILDVGAGDGAIELALLAGGYRVISVEARWNDVARRLGVRRVVADAAALPFRGGAFDAAVCFETIEHLEHPRAAAFEIARVIRVNAPLLLTTPSRWRYAVAPDPHFGIRGLVLLPPRWQRSIAARRGFDRADHYVDRLYGSTRQVAQTLAPLSIQCILSRSRMPQLWFWDAIILRNRV